MNSRSKVSEQNDGLSVKEMPSDILKEHVLKFITLSDEDLDSVVGFFQPLVIKKKKNLFEKGETCKRNYFVAKGCLRMFFIDDKKRCPNSNSIKLCQIVCCFTSEAPLASFTLVPLVLKGTFLGRKFFYTC